MTHHGTTFVCAEHRYASHWNKCPCGQGVFLGTKWRAPKKSNDRAWKMIQKGDFLWDKKAVVRKTTRWNEKMDAYMESLKRRNPKARVSLLRK